MGPHDTLFRQGDAGDAAFLVLSGRLRLLQHTGSGTDVALDVYGPGELIALTSALTVEPRAATCEALNAATVLRLPNSGVYDLMAASPALMKRVMAQVLARLRDAQDHVRELAAETAESRIARVVLRLADKSGMVARHAWICL